MSKKQRKSNQKNTELLALFTEKDLRLYRMNEFKKVLKEKNGIPMLLSYIFLNKEAGGRFQLGVDFPYHILRGGHIRSFKNENAILTEEAILTGVIDGLEEILKELKEDINKMIKEKKK